MYQNISIINALLVSSDGVKKSNLYISGGKITKISEAKDESFDTEITIDGEGLLLFPGMIDTHVHLRDSDFSYRESFNSGTKAAATAGITTVLEMPGCTKPASTCENLKQRYEQSLKQAYVNIGFYGGAGFDNIEHILPLAKAGVVGFKTFRMPPVKGREKEFYGLCSVSFDDLVSVMTQVAKTNLSLTIHCEDNDIILKETATQVKQGSTLSEFSKSRPEIAEIISVKQAIAAAKITGCKTIIAHVSSPKSVKLINLAKKDGVNIYVETCPQYMFFDEDSIKKHSVFARIKPPIRSKDSADELIKHFIDGDIDIIGSDHAPYTYEEKLSSGEDIWKTYDGIPSLEMSLRLLLNLYDGDERIYQRIAECTAKRAAGIFNLSGKGEIKVGYDADLVLIKQLKAKKEMDISDMYSKCKASAIIYDKMLISHEIQHTLIDGKIVYTNNADLADKCYGKIIN